MSALVTVLLASLGAIVVEVDGPADEVVALRDGVEWATAPVHDGRAVLRGLREGPWDVLARGATHASDPVRGVRAVPGPRRDADVRLATRPAHPVAIRARDGSRAWVGARSGSAPLLLPGGLHRLVVDHPALVSTPERLVRVGGPVRVAVEQEPGLVVTGTVAGAGGRPLAGARVRVFVDGWPASRTALTDAAGRFGVAGFRGDVVALEVAARGHATALHRVEFWPGDERARATVALSPGSRVAVSVRDEGGGPRLDAEAILLPEWVGFALDEPRLRASHLPATRRGGRTLSFSGLTPGRRYRLVVSAPGTRPRETAAFAAPGAGRTLRLPAVPLPPAAPVAGRVETADGVSAAGRTVVCVGPDGTRGARTDRHGRFSFDGLAAGPHVLRVRGRAASRWEGVLPADAAPRLRERPDAEGRALAGLVSDADGEPLPSVVVEALGRRTRTDGDGRFVLPGLPAGAGPVRVRCTPGAGCRALVADPHLPHVEEAAAPSAPLRVRLARAGTLRVRFPDPPVPLARTRLLLASAQGERRTVRLPRGALDATVPDLPAGSWVVELAAPRLLGTDGAVVDVRPGNGEVVPLRLVPGRRVRGRLVRRTVTPVPDGPPRIDDEPAGRGRVTLFDPDPRRALATTPVDPDGRFLLEGLPPGPVVLVAWTPGRPPDAVRVDLARADVADLVVPLHAGTSATLRITDVAGRPVPGARIERIVHDTGAERRDLVAVAAFRRVVAGEGELARLAHAFAVEVAGERAVVPWIAPGSWEFLVGGDGYRTEKVGIRVPLPGTLEQIRRLFPGLPAESRNHVRLERETGDVRPPDR